MVRKVLLVLGSLLLGVSAGIIIIFVLALSPLRFDHPILKTFGIRKPQIIGFLPYWLLDNASDSYEKYLTTYTYFGLVVDIDGKPIYLVNSQEEEPGWTTLKGERMAQKLENARKNNMKLSLLVHLADEEKIPSLLEDPVARAHALVSEVAPIMEKRGFTDLNLDIESFLPASDSARAKFTAFVQTVADDMDQKELGTLTVEIAPIALVKKFLIDPQAIGALADTIILMAYDYHYTGSLNAGPVAPIGGAGSVREYDVETAIKEALLVIPPEKLLLGIPLYGYQWETIEKNPGAATIPRGASVASARRAAEYLTECPHCQRVLDPLSKEPILIFPEGTYFNQIYYEDETSIEEKIALAREYKLGGVALWALGYEDPKMLTPLGAYKKSFHLSP